MSKRRWTILCGAFGVVLLLASAPTPAGSQETPIKIGVVDVERVVAESPQGKDLQSVFRELQLTDDLRAKQADYVGKLGELETGDDLFSDRRAAHQVTALEHHHFLARAGQGGRRHYSVVAAADDDCIIMVY